MFLFLKNLNCIIRKFHQKSPRCNPPPSPPLPPCNDIIPFSGAQGRVLHYLLDHPDEEIFQKDIEEEFGLRPSTATTLLQSMERKGLLRREPSEKDARYKKLTLTPGAEKHRGALFAEMSQLTEKLAGSIAPDDLKTWQKVTEQIIKNLILPKQDKRKTPQTATFQTAFSMKKRGNFIPPLFRCWLPQSLLR